LEGVKKPHGDNNKSNKEIKKKAGKNCARKNRGSEGREKKPNAEKMGKK